MEFIAAQETSVILSSHLVGDLERVCDYLIILSESRVLVAGDVEELLGTHYRLTGVNGHGLPPAVDVVDASHTDRQGTYVVRSSAPIVDPTWGAEPIGLEDLVLAYMSGAAARPVAAPEPVLEARR
jgi:ABC-2 type transport system ATP-binding protein